MHLINTQIDISAIQYIHRRMIDVKLIKSYIILVNILLSNVVSFAVSDQNMSGVQQGSALEDTNISVEATQASKSEPLNPRKSLFSMLHTHIQPTSSEISKQLLDGSSAGCPLDSTDNPNLSFQDTRTIISPKREEGSFFEKKLNSEEWAEAFHGISENVKQLNLANSNYRGQCIDKWLELNCLEEINLKNCRLFSEDWMRVMQAISSSVTSLNLRGSNYFGEEAERFIRYRDLKKLYLEDLDLNVQTWKNIFSAVKGSLEELFLGGSNFLDSSIENDFISLGYSLQTSSTDCENIISVLLKTLHKLYKLSIKESRYNMNLDFFEFETLEQLECGDSDCTLVLKLSHMRALSSILLKNQRGSCKVVLVDNSPLESLDLTDSSGVYEINITRSPHLNQVKLMNCAGLRKISLRICSDVPELNLMECPNLEFIELEECGSIWSINVDHHKNIKEIKLKKCDTFDLNANYCLELYSIILQDCTKLTSVRSDYCPKLTTIRLIRCPELTSLILKDVSELQNLDLVGDLNIRHLDMGKIEHLSWLDLRNCNALSAENILFIEPEKSGKNKKPNQETDNDKVPDWVKRKNVLTVKVNQKDEETRTAYIEKFKKHKVEFS